MLTWWVTSTRLPFAGRSEARARTSRVRSASSVRSRKDELSAGQGSAVPKARRAVSRHRHHWLDSTRPIGTPPEANAAPTRRACARPSSERRSEEHTSELQSLAYLVCRLLLEKKKTTIAYHPTKITVDAKCATWL